MRCECALLVVALVACGERRGDRTPVDRAAADKLFEEVPVATPPGMSDLTLDERGVLWAVSERDRMVIELELGKPPVSHPLDGVAFGQDTEAILALGGGRFAIGVEGGVAPAAAVLTAELRGDKVVVTDTRALTDKDVGLELEINHGIEALCGKDGDLVAAIETVGKTSDGRRWAPLVRVNGASIHTTRLYLTSKAGKISGMHCTIGDDGVAQVTAIERHFGVVRLLEFALARDAAEVTPVVDLDLFPVLHDNWNFEGVTRLRDGRLVLVNDNQTDKVRGPTHLFVFKPR
jgi:hypothetical protein